jgi:aminoglycoside phosphotransferase (APT) family kinase protein
VSALGENPRLMDDAVATTPATVASAGLADWLAHATDDPGPFELTRLSGGNSNETILVTSPRGRRLLRRPPEAAIDASAHSIEREYRILMALADTHVRVPRPIAVAREPAPGGPAALLMEFIDGVSISHRLPAGYPPSSVAMIGEQMVDTLADLHSLPWRELGLEDFGRPADFLARQVDRWRTQYERYRHRELPDFDLVAEWLEQNRPADGEPAILHGDFHVDNCLWSPDEPRLLAVIDWEMATIGDPLLDIGLAFGFWGGDRQEPVAMPRVQGFSRVTGAPTRSDLARRYEDRSGRSLEHLDYYMSLAFWKLAAIVEGAHLHYSTGRLRSEYASALEADVPALLSQARAFAGLA